ncbi:MAG: type III secretion system inner rod subunit SctI [Alphaproteobacteria bacterium]|nr:type III secretion system inner rod subunit SctI [Alphaproteobacteria bacterium]
MEPIAQLAQLGGSDLSGVGADAGAATASPDAARIERFQQIFQESRDARPEGVQAAQSADQASRGDALRTLELDRVAAPLSSTGDAILGGLSRLREAFDIQQSRLGQMADASTGSELIAVQLEVVQYSMLVDVTSKLTGKATQSFDTLMKGQ